MKDTNKKKCTVRICTSQKSCGEHYGPYIWERICRENNIDPSEESFAKKGITYTKSPCQGLCKKSSNIQIVQEEKKNITQFSYMNPLKAVKMMNSLQSGTPPQNIKNR